MQDGEGMAGTQDRSDRQLPLFGSKSLNPIIDLKREMALAARNCHLSRLELVDRMNALIEIERLRTKGKDGKVTGAMMDKWLAVESTDSVISLKLLPIFCRATGSLGPLRALAAPVGAAVIDQADQVLLKMARARVIRKDAARSERILEEQYKELTK